MLNYWKADAFRLLRAKSFWLMTLLSPAIYVVGIFMISGSGYSADTHMSTIMMVGVFAAIFSGLGIYNAVYSQDIKAGAMRVAIGRGTGRTQVVIAKFIESVVVTVLAGAVLYVIFRFVPLLFGVPANDTLNKVILVTVLQFLLQTVMYTSLASIVSMARQESVTATVVYVLLAAGIVDQILGLLFKIEAVKAIVGNAGAYLPQTLSNSLGSSIVGMGGTVVVSSVVVYVCYVAVSLVLASWVFHKKELEF